MEMVFPKRMATVTIPMVGCSPMLWKSVTEWTTIVMVRLMKDVKTNASLMNSQVGVGVAPVEDFPLPCRGSLVRFLYLSDVAPLG